MAVVNIKAQHLNAFIKATMETFATMVNLAVVPGKIRMKDKQAYPYDVSGIIGLGGGVKGAVAMSFPRASAIAVVRGFMGEKTVTPGEMVDAIGELANIVVGAAKKDLAAFKIKISLPTVINGENHSISGPVDASSLVVPFEFPGGKFDMAVCFKSLI